MISSLVPVVCPILMVLGDSLDDRFDGRSFLFVPIKRSPSPTLSYLLTGSVPEQLMRHHEIGPDHGGTGERVPGTDTPRWRRLSADRDQHPTTWARVQDGTRQAWRSSLESG